MQSEKKHDYILSSEVNVPQEHYNKKAALSLENSLKPLNR